MEIRQLKYFVKIVDLGGFSRAAGTLCVAQSALSLQVAALESELGVPLLTRTSRGAVPTESGHELYRHAQVILAQAETARAAVMSGSDQPAGPVSLGIPLSLVSTFGLQILQNVRAHYPKISLQIHEELSGTILEWVKNGRLSAGLAFDDGNFQGLRVTPLLEERLFLVVDPKSPYARRKTLGVSELQNIDLVLPTREQGNRTRLEYAMSRQGLAPPRVLIEANSQIIMRHVVAAGMCASVLAWPGIVHDIDAGILCAVEIVRPQLARVSALCTQASSPTSREVECVLSACIEAVTVTVRQHAWRGVRVLHARDDASVDDAARNEGLAAP